MYIVGIVEREGKCGRRVFNWKEVWVFYILDCVLVSMLIFLGDMLYFFYVNRRDCGNNILIIWLS